MKLLGNTKINLTKTENCKNMPYLQITEIILVYLNLVIIYYQNNSKVLFTFALNKRLVNYSIFYLKLLYF